MALRRGVRILSFFLPPVTLFKEEKNEAYEIAMIGAYV
jgi:hypothetical protein